MGGGVVEAVLGGAIEVVGYACCGLIKLANGACDCKHVQCSECGFVACMLSNCNDLCKAAVNHDCCKAVADVRCYQCCRESCRVYVCCMMDRTLCLCCDLCCPVEGFGHGNGHHGGYGHRSHSNGMPPVILMPGGGGDYSSNTYVTNTNQGQPPPSQQSMHDKQHEFEAQQQWNQTPGNFDPMQQQHQQQYNQVPNQSPHHGHPGQGYAFGHSNEHHHGQGNGHGWGHDQGNNNGQGNGWGNEGQPGPPSPHQGQGGGWSNQPASPSMQYNPSSPPHFFDQQQQQQFQPEFIQPVMA